MEPNSTFTCPWWLLFTFDNPLRKWIHDPRAILGPYVGPGDTVLDVGCGMGYFSLGLAELVGEEGRVISADVQDEMLTGLRKRAGRAGLLPRIQIHQAGSDRVGVEGPVDFVLAFWMVHEVRDQAAFLQEIYDLLKQGGRFLIAEPNVHVSGRAFNEMISLGKAIGFHSGGRPRVRASRAVLFQK